MAPLAGARGGCAFSSPAFCLTLLAVTTYLQCLVGYSGAFVPATGAPRLVGGAARGGGQVELASGAHSSRSGSSSSGLKWRCSGSPSSGSGSSSSSSSSSSSRSTSRSAGVSSALASTSPAAAESSSAGDDVSPEEERPRTLILSSVERARTVTHVATYGTLSTFAVSNDTALHGAPFGSHVDFVLDDNGWPVFLLAEASMHTQNINANNQVSLLVQMLPGSGSAPAAALPRVTLVGNVVDVTDDDELIQFKANFPLTHKYADALTQSPSFKFFKLRPDKVYYVGGFGVMSKFIDIPAYEAAKPDILADEAPDIVTKINRSKKEDIYNVCRRFLGIENVEKATVTMLDRLGLDIRVSHGARTDEFRIGFRQPVASTEDAKSEIVKIFQEAWEKEKGYEWADQGPPTQRYAEDILRRKK